MGQTKDTHYVKKNVQYFKKQNYRKMAINTFVDGQNNGRVTNKMYQNAKGINNIFHARCI